MKTAGTLDSAVLPVLAPWGRVAVFFLQPANRPNGSLGAKPDPDHWIRPVSSTEEAPFGLARRG